MENSDGSKVRLRTGGSNQKRSPRTKAVQYGDQKVGLKRNSSRGKTVGFGTFEIFIIVGELATTKDEIKGSEGSEGSERAEGEERAEGGDCAKGSAGLVT